MELDFCLLLCLIMGTRWHLDTHGGSASLLPPQGHPAAASRESVQEEDDGWEMKDWSTIGVPNGGVSVTLGFAVADLCDHTPQGLAAAR